MIYGHSVIEFAVLQQRVKIVVHSALLAGMSVGWGILKVNLVLPI